MGVLECQDLIRAQEMDKFMNTLLQSVRFSCGSPRCSKLTSTSSKRISPWYFPDVKIDLDSNADFIREVFLRCNAREVVERCRRLTQVMAKEAYGPNSPIPEIKM